LVENGLKFTPAGGQVRVEADVRDNWVYLTVADSGIGIAPDKLEHIFEAFYQIDGSITRQYEGLGLGLAVARAVIRAHGGEVEVESQVGQGTQFTIQLPAMTNPILTAPPVAADKRLKRILVVDDEEFVTFTLQEGLEKLPNCEVATANSGQQALQIFEQHPFDLLITDYRMPDIDGISLVRQIWQKQPHLAIIMITAYGDSILRNQRAEVPVQYILDKPVKLADIRNLTIEMLAGRSTSADRAYIN
jgi:CheY-like chemotaxis protein